MRAPETIHGRRVVAAPQTLDAIAWPPQAVVLRIAPDDALVIGAESVGVGSEHAIVVDDSGFCGCWLNASDLARVAEHIDWPLPPPAARPALAQGLVAGVPAKLWLTASTSGDDVALLLTNAPYAHELWERL